MREISAGAITETVARLFREVNVELPADVFQALQDSVRREESPLGKKTLSQLVENAQLAREERIPVCQDCGIAVVFLEIGQDVHVSGGDISEAVNEGVRRAYGEGFFRKSMVCQPFSERVNTGDNTPAVIHFEIVPGDRLRIAVMPKGGGSENMSRLFMLLPAEGRNGIINAVVKAVDEAGSNPCPPVIVGVGVGGTADQALVLSKKALLRPVGVRNSDPETAQLEKELLERVNSLGIGPEGFGGRVTALAVNLEVVPAHITGLPVAVSLLCHAARRKDAVI